MELLTPLALGGRTAPNRVLFGPHVTNLGDKRAISARHVAYYERRARGGCGTIVVEEAAIHESDWPYERAPLAADCAGGWGSVASAGHAHGSLVLAALGHSGGQGSSAYSQRELWAPSRVPEVASREVPKWMEEADIAAVLDGFGDAAELAVRAGCDGVEVNAGQHSLLRQFLSGLTNHRDDEWGTDRTRFARHAIEAARHGVERAAPGSGAIVGLRLSCDELAPWAGITPEQALDVVATLSPLVDYLVVVRGSIYSADKTRADHHEPAGYNRELCRAMAAVAAAPVVLQGSVVDPAMAEAAVASGEAALVEMTRAQIADPDLVAKLHTEERARKGRPRPQGPAGAAVRPCVRCNQACMVRDPRNPLVSCIVEPTSGHEWEDPDWYAGGAGSPAGERNVLVVGGGVAGMEAARLAAERGHTVALVERSGAVGGMAAVAGPAAPFVAWLAAELARLGVAVHTGVDGAAAIAAARSGGGEIADRSGGGEIADHVLQCTGSRPGTATYGVSRGALVVDVAALRRGEVALPPAGAVVVHDPVGGPIGVALAEELGERAVLVTPDQVAGNELARSGDLAPANVRLAQRGVTVVRRATVVSARNGSVVIRDRFGGGERTIAAVALVDCGFRLPDEPLAGATARAGDCVAPRTVLEAVLDARRAVLALER